MFEICYQWMTIPNKVEQAAWGMMILGLLYFVARLMRK